MSLNVYVREIGEGADVEIRYLAITPVLFKDTKSYRNDAVVNKVFNRIDSLLAQ